MLKNLTRLLVVAFLLSFVGYTSAVGENTLTGVVEKVIDGDSLLIRAGHHRYEVRLWGIDCPEFDQPFGTSARKLSRKLLDGRVVTVLMKERDSYGRMVAVVYRNEFNINEELVRQGTAWVYDRYCREAVCRDWKILEKQARSSGEGLWAGTHPVPPWKWRRERDRKTAPRN